MSFISHIRTLTAVEKCNPPQPRRAVIIERASRRILTASIRGGGLSRLLFRQIISKFQSLQFDWRVRKGLSRFGLLTPRDRFLALNVAISVSIRVSLQPYCLLFKSSITQFRLLQLAQGRDCMTLGGTTWDIIKKNCLLNFCFSFSLHCTEQWCLNRGMNQTFSVPLHP
jgi:hypothetical protein